MNLPAHFLQSETDGGLYDTREPGWSGRPALRPAYRYVFSAIERGDYADHGFAMPGGWLDSMADAPCGPAFVPIKNQYAIGLRAAVDLCGGPFIDCGGWFDVADPVPDYRTGSDTSYSLHPPEGITAASYARLAHLLGATR